MSTTENVAVARLEAEARRSIALLGEQPANWVPASEHDHDVAIVGAGQSGLAIAFALRRAGIGSVTVLDARKAGEEGVWLGSARMHTLRTPKAPPGPELGIPSLSFQAWYEASFGADAYRDMKQIPRAAWAEYLAWFRCTAEIEVRNGAQVQWIEPQEGGFVLHLERDGRTFRETARKVVLATGIAGSGGPFVPPEIADALPRSHYAHTHDAMDFRSLWGQTVGILGSAASAFDAAGAALEAGATEVHLFCRGDDVERSSGMKNLSYPGAWEHFHALPDADRWHLMHRFRRRASFPPLAAVERATRFKNFHLHLGAGWRATEPVGNATRIFTRSGERHQVDFVIAATGYRLDVDGAPELAAFADSIARWSDRYAPPSDEADPVLASSPYLGPGFQLMPRVPGTAPFLADIHFMGFAGTLSNGRPAGDIPSLRHNVARLVSAIGRDLFLADRKKHIARLSTPVPEDLPVSAYAGAIRSGGSAAA
jgi:cation diffusion facilitator CzcD-associated flavoprotein CzcO